MTFRAGVALALLLHAAAAAAQTYPDKPVRVVVPFPAGGAADIVARQVVQGLGASLGGQFIVDSSSILPCPRNR